MKQVLQVVVLVVTLFMVAAAVARGSSSNDSMKEFLLATAASDFATHGPAPEGFRNVHLRYLEGEESDGLHMLCGEFTRQKDGTDPVWIAFATLKTAPYEHWIGGAASGWCAAAVPVNPVGEELSSELTERVKTALR